MKPEVINRKENHCMIQLVMRRLDLFEASTMTWLILFLGLFPEGRPPITGDGAPLWSDEDEFPPPRP
jgi:hypothetical protein